jgi:hypothetical protein
MISGVVALSGNSCGSISSTGGTFIWVGDSVIGVLSLMSIPLEETTHTFVEMEGCRIGGAPW